MNKEPPPSYEQSQGLSQPYPNPGQIGFQVPPVNPQFQGAGAPYPSAGQPYPGAGTPYPYPQENVINAQPYHVGHLQGAPVYVAGVQNSGPQSVTVTAVPIVISGSDLGPNPANVFCPKCQQSVMTKIKYEAGPLAWASCIALALFGCWMGCCLIPFCIDGCNNFYHTCPRCKTFLGKRSALS